MWGVPQCMSAVGLYLSHLIVALNRTLQELVLKQRKIKSLNLCRSDAEEKLYIPNAILFINSTSV